MSFTRQPTVKYHPGAPLRVASASRCPYCGCERSKVSKTTVTTAVRVRQHVCLECTGWYRSLEDI